MRLRGWLDDFLQDLRFATRMFGRAQRTFVMTSTVTLALAVGVTTAVFTVVSGLLLRPLPFPHAERLIALRGTTAHSAEGQQVTNLPFYRNESHLIESIAAYDVGARYLQDGDHVERVMVVRTEPAFFAVLGVPPLMGQTYDGSGGPSVVVLSEGFWRRHLGGNPDVVGRTVTLDGRAYTVRGIMPDSFQFPYRAGMLLEGPGGQQRTDLWIAYERPLPASARLGTVVARLISGATIASAQQELDTIARHIPGNEGHGVAIVPLADSVVPAATRRLILLFFAAVIVVLTLACANVTNLSLARGLARQQEVAVRAALGASVSRLTRQLLAESLFVACIGGIGGLLLASWLVRELVNAAATYLPRAREIAFDWRVFLFTVGVCGAAGAAVAIGPALMVARRDQQGALTPSGDRTTLSVRQRRLRDALVIGEVALAFVLGVAASALLSELWRLRRTDPGLVAQNVVTFHIGQVRDAQARDGRRLYEIAERVTRVSGVQAAGFAQMLPLQNWGWAANATDFGALGRAPQGGEYTMELRFVTPGYFEAMGIPIRQGRGFSAADYAAAPGVVIINEALARRAFPGQDAIGVTTNRGLIVGTIGDVRQAGLDQPPLPELYTPIAQNWTQLSDLGMTLVVRTYGRPEPLVDPIRAAIRETAPGVAIFGVKTMEAVVADSLSAFMLSLWILVGFAMLAVALALTGTYGVISYLASARTREFAIRMALGSSAAQVGRSVVRHAMAVTATGLGVGLAAALVAMPLIGRAAVRVEPPGLGAVSAVAAFVIATATVAALVPALRAANVDPLAALKSE